MTLHQSCRGVAWKSDVRMLNEVQTDTVLSPCVLTPNFYRVRRRGLALCVLLTIFFLLYSGPSMFRFVRRKAPYMMGEFFPKSNLEKLTARRHVRSRIQSTQTAQRYIAAAILPHSCEISRLFHSCENATSQVGLILSSSTSVFRCQLELNDNPN